MQKTHVEPLEKRELLTAFMGDLSSVEEMNVLGRYVGTLSVTRASGARIVGDVAAGAVARGARLPVELRITDQDVDGFFGGTMVVRGMGLAGPSGPFRVRGRVIGGDVLMAMEDQALGMAAVDGRLVRGGSIRGRFASRITGDEMEGRLRLGRRRISRDEFSAVLSTRPLPNRLGFGDNTGSRFLASIDSGNVFAGFAGSVGTRFDLIGGGFFVSMRF